MIQIEEKDHERKLTKRTVKDIYADLKALLKIPGRSMQLPRLFRHRYWKEEARV